MKTWKQIKIRHHKLLYKDWAERFAGHSDDRQVYVNTYNMILEALESMEEEPNNFIAVAINHEISKEYKMMDEIIQRFRTE